MTVCSEWYEQYFQKKHFQWFLKEWLLERWNVLVRDFDELTSDDKSEWKFPMFLTKLVAGHDEECCDISILKYGLRWLRLFLGEHLFGSMGKNINEEQVIRNAEQHENNNNVAIVEPVEEEYEDDEDDEEEDENDHEEVNDEKWMIKRGSPNSHGCLLEMIFTKNSILYA
ncbi:hypothetical protein FDP41_013738 [Naegleria fowleri]|uniref:Uncharacterized protein n=1 Tax=Naegleria fowleri TaxID=5763 RepID=A0A6A5C1V4_NAEFO|nr:uncharacterized protein FDP41_013738 [Naegleria fowleri]KAF0980524.1 hypothetical protein FDP41_013738 [Naegleria fowleri]